MSSEQQQKSLTSSLKPLSKSLSKPSSQSTPTITTTPATAADPLVVISPTAQNVIITTPPSTPVFAGDGTTTTTTPSPKTDGNTNGEGREPPTANGAEFFIPLPDQWGALRIHASCQAKDGSGGGGGAKSSSDFKDDLYRMMVRIGPNGGGAGPNGPSGGTSDGTTKRFFPPAPLGKHRIFAPYAKSGTELGGSLPNTVPVDWNQWKVKDTIFCWPKDGVTQIGDVVAVDEMIRSQREKFDQQLTQIATATPTTDPATTTTTTTTDPAQSSSASSKQI